MTLEQIADDPELLEVGRNAIEDQLIEMRDSRMFEFGRRNGFVVCEKNGDRSDIIRFGPEVGLRIALRAIAAKIKETP